VSCWYYCKIIWLLDLLFDKLTLVGWQNICNPNLTGWWSHWINQLTRETTFQRRWGRHHISHITKFAKLALCVVQNRLVTKPANGFKYMLNSKFYNVSTIIITSKNSDSFRFEKKKPPETGSVKNQFLSIQIIFEIVICKNNFYLAFESNQIIVVTIIMKIYMEIWYF
jgi:hypothetical protein